MVLGLWSETAGGEVLTLIVRQKPWANVTRVRKTAWKLAQYVWSKLLLAQETVSVGAWPVVVTTFLFGRKDLCLLALLRWLIGWRPRLPQDVTAWPGTISPTADAAHPDTNALSTNCFHPHVLSGFHAPGTLRSQKIEALACIRASSVGLSIPAKLPPCVMAILVALAGCSRIRPSLFGPLVEERRYLEVRCYWP